MRLPSIKTLFCSFGRQVDARPAGGGVNSFSGTIDDSITNRDSSAATQKAALHARAETTSSSALPPPSSSSKSRSPSASESSSLLLLKGDEFHVSSDGVARTFYQLIVPSSQGDETVPISIEEVYELRTARKTYLLRQATAAPALPSSTPPWSRTPHVLRTPAEADEGIAPLGCTLAHLELQEVDPSRRVVLDGDAPGRTGGTTWESSIAMALYFASRPLDLAGHVIELGSGVGLGGILANLGPRWNENFASGLVESITLTDSDDVVLRQCRSNIANVLGFFPAEPQMHVCKLEWNDAAGRKDTDAKNLPVGQSYDTVLACDCVYRHEDVPVLAQAMVNLLDDTPRAKIHLFSPYNRSPLSDMVTRLKNLGLLVEVDVVEMNRYRLKPSPKHGWWHSSSTKVKRDAALQECMYASKAVASFMHITAVHNPSRNDSRALYDVD